MKEVKLVVRTSGLPHDFDKSCVGGDCLYVRDGVVFFRSVYKGRRIKRRCDVVSRGLGKGFSFEGLCLASVSVWTPFHLPKSRRFKKLILCFT